jgi:hypothetical protein
MDRLGRDIQRFVLAIICFIFGIGFLFGYIIAWCRTETVMEYRHWQELVRRGYAVEVESSAGKGYKWKEEVR